MQSKFIRRGGHRNGGELCLPDNVKGVSVVQHSSIQDLLLVHLVHVDRQCNNNRLRNSMTAGHPESTENDGIPHWIPVTLGIVHTPCRMHTM